MRKPTTQSSEIELTLVPRSKQPQQIQNKVSAIHTILNYRLAHHSNQIIHDTYFDTLSEALNTFNLSLRLRLYCGRLFITLKGPREAVSPLAVKRLELEMPWSLAAVRSVIYNLNRIANTALVECPKEDLRFQFDNPQDALLNAGLRVIQRRTTIRQILTISLHNQSGEGPLAELMIDRVRFDIRNRSIMHHEIEIEQKVIGTSVLDDVGGELVSMFGDALQPWRYSKLRTGIAVGRLIDIAELDQVIDEQNNLTSDAYKRIDRLLRNMD